MRVRVAVLMVAAGVIVTGVLSGHLASGAVASPGAGSQAPDTPRTRAVRALDAIARRIRDVEPFVANGHEDAVRVDKQLRARAGAIRVRVDELDPHDAEQRGAWAGVRSSIAELEYRTDMFVLESRSESMGFHEAAAPMFEETSAWLDELGASLDAQGRLDHSRRIESLRAELERIRSASADDVPARRAEVETRVEWSKRLAALRRELRSLDRRKERHSRD
ncbi:MAG: hypothetical protein ACREL7_13270 [Longimicrobiales bacterium]